MVLLYSGSASDLAELSAGIEQNIKSIPDFEVAFISPIYDSFIPLQGVRQSLARVIFLLSSVEETLRILCLAFHEGMIFPNYQWVFKEQFEHNFVETTFSYKGKSYICTEEEISISIHGSINFVWSLSPEKNVDDRLASIDYEEGYKRQRSLYVNEYNVSSMPVEWARGIYDAVWSLAFALNSSLDDLNMNLAQIVPGSKAVAQAIANHMSDINFQGVSGSIDFDNETGFYTDRRINIYQFGVAKSSTLIDFYSKEHMLLFNDITARFIMSTFDKKHIVLHVSTAIAILFIIIQVTVLLLILPIQVINIIYRNHSSIKATSPKLKHLIFLGFYLSVVGMVLHTVIEAWPHTMNDSMLSNTCNTLPWFFNIGTTLVTGTLCAKTWRLYKIYTSTKRVVRLKSKKITDTALIGYVGGFVSVDVLLCLLWICTDPPRYIKTVSESKILPMITVTGSCQSTWLLYWTSALILYKCVLIACSFFLALSTKLRWKEFKTDNVIVLSYILAIAVGLGVSIFTVISIVDVGISIQFIVASVFMDTVIYICLSTLFFPSIINFPLL